MMDKHNSELDNWAINAFADGELDDDEQARVEALLLQDADARRVLDSIKQQNAALKRAFDPVLQEPVPPFLIAIPKSRRARLSGPFAAVAASLAILALGAGLGWFAAHESGSALVADLGRRAIVAHEVYAVEVKHPVEVDASQAEHIRAWLGKRIGTPIKIPNLAAAGYTFIGGRLLAADDRPAGQLMYEDANKKRLSIFFASNPTQREDSIHVRETDALVSCYWADPKLAMAITGDMPREAMMMLANSIYDEMEKI